MVLIIVIYGFTLGLTFFYYFLKMLNILKSTMGLKAYLIPLFYYNDFYGLINSENNKEKKIEYNKILFYQKVSILVLILGLIILFVIANTIETS